MHQSFQRYRLTEVWGYPDGDTFHYVISQNHICVTARLVRDIWVFGRCQTPGERDKVSEPSLSLESSWATLTVSCFPCSVHLVYFPETDIGQTRKAESWRLMSAVLLLRGENVVPVTAASSARHSVSSVVLHKWALGPKDVAGTVRTSERRALQGRRKTFVISGFFLFFLLVYQERFKGNCFCSHLESMTVNGVTTHPCSWVPLPRFLLRSPCFYSTSL